MKKDRWQRLKEWWIVRRYTSAGLTWGDAESYAPFMGQCTESDRLEKKLRYWESRYCELGYSPVPDSLWILAGGYGRPFAHRLYQASEASPIKEENTGASLQ